MRPGRTDGAMLFARYAYPPNALGYCGPDESRTLLEYGAAGVSDGGLVQIARGFEGAWPYLRLIAAASGIADPLHARVVEAYWVGHALLDRVHHRVLGRFLEERFRPMAGRRWGALSGLALSGAVPHHNLHVFGVYPWVGLMRTGFATEEPLRVLDHCRVRAGEVMELRGERVRVRSLGLSWDGQRICLGAPREEWVTASVGGLRFVRGLRTGDRVSLHWDWVCDRLSPRQERALRRETDRALAAVNGGVAHRRLPGVMGP